MNIIITGADGQLARDLVRTAPSHDHILALPKSELDITRADQIENIIKKTNADRVINTAAYTGVDQAETEQEQALALNRDGPRLLAEILARADVSLVHYSTDYVFDGEKHSPYTTADTPHPINVYGASKLEGEKAVIEALGTRAIIIRTAWLYSGHGANFVMKMLGLMQSRDTLRVVADQIGTPTWTRSLAHATWQLMPVTGLHGIHHFCDAGATTWFEFSRAIQETAWRYGLLTNRTQIMPVTTAEYGAPARRPAYSVLDCTQTWRLLKQEPDNWRVALEKLLLEMKR